MCREESGKGVISPKVHCVAVIDDDDDLREGVASLLVAEGYDVLCFSTVNELLRIRKTHVDCFIVGIERAFATSISLQLQLSDAIGKTRVIYVGNDIPNAMAIAIFWCL